MLTTLAAIGAGASLGALSSVHCGAMCGPLVAVGCRKSGRADGGELGSYLAGRTLGYVLAGTLAAAVGAPLISGAAGRGVQVAIAALVGVVLAVRGVSLLRASRGSGLAQIRLPPTAMDRALAKLLSAVPRRGASLGLATAIFPCGALWAALLSAVATGNAVSGAVTMLSFSLASAPALVLPALVAGRMSSLSSSGRKRRWFEGTAGAFMLVLAAWVVAAPLMSMAKSSTNAKAPACAHCHR